MISDRILRVKRGNYDAISKEGKNLFLTWKKKRWGIASRFFNASWQCLLVSLAFIWFVTPSGSGVRAVSPLSRSKQSGWKVARIHRSDKPDWELRKMLIKTIASALIAARIQNEGWKTCCILSGVLMCTLVGQFWFHYLLISSVAKLME